MNRTHLKATLMVLAVLAGMGWYLQADAAVPHVGTVGEAHNLHPADATGATADPGNPGFCIPGVYTVYCPDPVDPTSPIYAAPPPVVTLDKLAQQYPNNVVLQPRYGWVERPQPKVQSVPEPPAVLMLLTALACVFAFRIGRIHRLKA